MIMRLTNLGGPGEERRRENQAGTNKNTTSQPDKDGTDRDKGHGKARTDSDTAQV